VNGWLKKDISVKIVSVLIAVILWLYVYNESNPFATKVIFSVPIRVENESYLDANGFQIKNKRGTIDITIRGRKESVDRVRTSDFEAVLDLSQIKSVNDRNLKLTGPFCSQRDVKIISYSPSNIDVQLTRNKSGAFPVQLKSNITMKPGYVLLGTTMTPNSFPIVAEESIIDSVDSIRARLDIRNLDRDITKEVTCKVYNKDGNEINSLSNDLKVSVKIEVAKEVPVSLVTRGRLADDYIETLRVIDPAKIQITGPAAQLAAMNDIKTEQVNIDRISSNYNASVPLVIPEGIKLVNNQQKEVKVGINIEKLILRNVELGKSDINILNAANDGVLTYEILTDKLQLQLKGRQPDVESIRLPDLKPAVDVAGLSEGTHRLPLNIKLPAQVKLIQPAFVEIKVARQQDAGASAPASE
jgi:YbbR domain-containing protein